MDGTADTKTCEECHVDDWGEARTAPDWTDKSDMSLCRGMHSIFRNNAAGFIDHVVRDGGHPPGFIKLAFDGKRGLLDGGMTIYETETGRKITAAPPPGTHAQLIQQARGLGSSKPAGLNTTAEGRQNNRRVELVKI